MSDWMPALGNTSRPDRPMLLQRLNRFDNCLEKLSVYVSDDADFSPPSPVPPPLGRTGGSVAKCQSGDAEQIQLQDCEEFGVNVKRALLARADKGIE